MSRRLKIPTVAQLVRNFPPLIYGTLGCFQNPKLKGKAVPQHTYGGVGGEDL
jgi:hypothetical protein